MIAFIALMILCYEGSTIKKVSVVMVLYPIIVSLNFIGNSIIKFLSLRLIENSILQNSTLIIKMRLYHVIWVLVLSFIWFIIYKLMKDKIADASQYINDKTWVLIDIICVSPLISIVATIILTGDDEDYKAYVIAIACIISNIGILLLIQYIIKSVKVKLENRSYKLQYDYYKSLEEKQHEIRKLKHDMNDHLQVIQSFLTYEDAEKASKYYNNICEKSISLSNKVFCKNSIINAVINNKYSLIQKNQIDNSINIVY